MNWDENQPTTKETAMRCHLNLGLSAHIKENIWKLWSFFLYVFFFDVGFYIAHIFPELTM